MHNNTEYTNNTCCILLYTIIHNNTYRTYYIYLCMYNIYICFIYIYVYMFYIDYTWLCYIVLHVTLKYIYIYTHTYIWHAYGVMLCLEGIFLLVRCHAGWPCLRLFTALKLLKEAEGSQQTPDVLSFLATLLQQDVQHPIEMIIKQEQRCLDFSAGQ